MTTDNIVEVGIDSQRRLFIKPEAETFGYLYRAAAEVNWDNKDKFLYSPEPREWTYLDWFKHIIAIVKDEYGCTLQLKDTTKWTDI